LKKILTVIGARPQFIKSAPVSIALKQSNFNETLLHTGQHYDEKMSDVFFRELKLDSNYINLNTGSASHSVQTAKMLIGIEETVNEIKPDGIVVYGDTNSTLAASIVSSKEHIPLFHIEAGLRSFNKKMPEELNRIATDHFSDLLLCPTETAVRNLKNESITNGVYLTGDVMLDATKKFSAISCTIDLPKKFALLTIHRPQNVDHENFLKDLLEQLNQENFITLFPCHPRTVKKAKEIIEKFYLKNIKITEPFSYIEMLHTIKCCDFVITDSGGLQKEAMFLKKACITLRPDTEWVETIQYGWNTLTDQNLAKLHETIHNINNYEKRNCLLFGDGNASEKIASHLNNFYK
jgi:UDP-GlcNAc3NAcA epimerase